MKQTEVIYLYSAKRRREELEIKLKLERGYVDYLLTRLLHLYAPSTKKHQKAVTLTVRSGRDEQRDFEFRRLVPKSVSPLVVDDEECDVLEAALWRVCQTAIELQKTKRAIKRIEN